MADITMCSGVLENNEICPFREQCYRFLAPQNRYRQSYFVTPPYDKEKGCCEQFWKYTRPA